MSTPQPPPTRIEFSATRNTAGWLYEQQASLLASTYESGLLFMIGVKPDGQISYERRAVARCMGLHATPQAIVVGTQFQVWRFQNTVLPGETYRGFDAYYVPRVSWTTGDVDVHDVGVTRDGKVVFVNTAFSCIAEVDDKFSFKPYWTPPFISKLAAEDRCHLNGMALVDGVPTYATCVSRSDAAGGWRDFRVDGGLLMHIPSNEVIVSGLSMPHSPRWHEGKLYLLNSGTGEFGFVDVERGRFEPIAFCPGYLRGLSFLNGYAIAGLSMGRENTFGNLPLTELLQAKGAMARCALQIIDLQRGDVQHEIRIVGDIRELYDTGVLPGVRVPGTVGFMSEEFLKRITLETDGPWPAA